MCARRPRLPTCMYAYTYVLRMYLTSCVLLVDLWCEPIRSATRKFVLVCWKSQRSHCVCVRVGVCESVCACVGVCAHAWVCVCVYVCLHESSYSFFWVCYYIYVRAFRDATCLRPWPTWIGARLRAYMYTYVYVWVCTYIQTHRLMHVCVCVHTCVCARVRI